MSLTHETPFPTQVPSEGSRIRFNVKIDIKGRDRGWSTEEAIINALRWLNDEVVSDIGDRDCLIYRPRTHPQDPHLRGWRLERNGKQYPAGNVEVI